jgi:thiamine kinase-like enzyme
MTSADRDINARERAARLSIWHGPVEPVRLSGGITNVNFVVEDAGARYVVRVGDDIVVHQIMRFNERAANEAAFAAKVSPEVIHSEPGVLVMRFVEGRTCSPADIRDPARLAKILPLIKRVHRELPRHLRGPALAFWVFHVIRDYAHTLTGSQSRYVSRLPDFVDVAAGLELAVGPVDLVFGHNDLIAGNFIDDGSRIWLIDWDYAGFNSPLFDLSNLASNSEFNGEQEGWMLATYFGRAPDAALMLSYHAMKCASLLREAMWAMVSEIHSQLDFDYGAYAVDYMDRFARAYSAYEQAKS